ncbi:MATE family efflux transporter [Pararhodobacter sp.]|uniref:MATE family efflux transporter n=1 Tax=Pararhodobacter sp. TaxID=2127056 RepID=UPI002AFEF5DC|nr:MATE family efflux transporter [Pararhodobacter sp.]
MTAGPIQDLTHARVLRIALPIVAANVTVPLLGLVDTAVIGQLGQAAPIGAVGLGAVILSSVYWIFGFLRMGTTGLTAQAHGAGNAGEVGAILKRGLLIAAAGGLLLIAVQLPFFWAAFRIAPASAEVESFTRTYLAVRIWGAPAIIATYALSGWLIALERTRAVLALQLVMNGTNIALDIAFVIGLGWGIAGVASATVIAEWSGVAFGLWLCRDGLATTSTRVFDALRLRHMASVNGDIMVRSVLLTGSFTTFLFVSAGQGDTQLAANQILLQFLTLMAFLLDGFAFAAETLVGQAVGARRASAFRQAVRLSALWCAGGALLMALGFALFGTTIIDLLTTAPDVRASARVFLIWAVLSPLFGVASFLLDGIFIGATRTKEMRNAMIVSVAVYAVALWLLSPIGNHGLWAAMFVLYGMRAVTLAALYPRIPRALEAP